MRERVWKLDDAAIGVSLWTTERDAMAVRRHRRTRGVVSLCFAEPGDLVSELGRPDRRIPGRSPCCASGHPMAPALP